MTTSNNVLLALKALQNNKQIDLEDFETLVEVVKQANVRLHAKTTYYKAVLYLIAMGYVHADVHKLAEIALIDDTVDAFYAKISAAHFDYIVKSAFAKVDEMSFARQYCTFAERVLKTLIEKQYVGSQSDAKVIAEIASHLSYQQVSGENK